MLLAPPSNPAFEPPLSKSRLPTYLSPNAAPGIGVARDAQRSNQPTRAALIGSGYHRRGAGALESDAAAILIAGMWIAGKPGSSSFKVHLDGEPQPLAIKADVQLGWVEVLVPARECMATDGLNRPKTRVLKGVVTLVATNE